MASLDQVTSTAAKVASSAVSTAKTNSSRKEAPSESFENSLSQVQAAARSRSEDNATDSSAPAERSAPQTELDRNAGARKTKAAPRQQDNQTSPGRTDDGGRTDSAADAGRPPSDQPDQTSAANAGDGSTSIATASDDKPAENAASGDQGTSEDVTAAAEALANGAAIPATSDSTKAAGEIAASAVTVQSSGLATPAVPTAPVEDAVAALGAVNTAGPKQAIASAAFDSKPVPAETAPLAAATGEEIVSTDNQKADTAVAAAAPGEAAKPVAANVAHAKTNVADTLSGALPAPTSRQSTSQAPAQQAIATTTIAASETAPAQTSPAQPVPDQTASPAAKSEAETAAPAPVASAPQVSAATPASPANAAPPQTAELVREHVPLDRLGVEIATTARAGIKEIAVKLDPPELGRIDVRLDIDDSGQVNTHLIVERASTLDQLRRDAPNLERLLNQAGVKADSGSLQFSLRDHNQPYRQPGGDARRTRRGVLAIDGIDSAASAGQPPPSPLAGLSRQGVDIRL